MYVSKYLRLTKNDSSGPTILRPSGVKGRRAETLDLHDKIDGCSEIGVNAEVITTLSAVATQAAKTRGICIFWRLRDRRVAGPGDVRARSRGPRNALRSQKSNRLAGPGMSSQLGLRARASRPGPGRRRPGRGAVTRAGWPRAGTVATGPEKESKCARFVHNV
jgi:hypothetical protein